MGKMSSMMGGMDIKLRRNGEGSQWKPDQDALNNLMAMGMGSEARCTEALEVNMNDMNMAINWLFDQPPESPVNTDAPQAPPVAPDKEEAAEMWRRIRDTVGVAALTADALKNMAQEADRLTIVDS